MRHHSKVACWGTVNDCYCEPKCKKSIKREVVSVLYYKSEQKFWKGVLFERTANEKKLNIITSILPSFPNECYIESHRTKQVSFEAPSIVKPKWFLNSGYHRKKAGKLTLTVLR